MADALQATIQRVTQNSTVDPLGRVVNTVQVQYAVGDHGPFFVTLPANGFSAAAAMAAIQPTVAEINALLNPPAKL
jgi:hypothetical protein